MIVIMDEPTPEPSFEVQGARAARTRVIARALHTAPVHLWPRMPGDRVPNWPTGWSL